ncbi:unnamed protein product [Closterium sp. NIES-53]
MATEAEKSAMDQGHTAESANSPPPPPAGVVAVAAAPLAPPAPPAAAAPSSVPVPVLSAPQPNLPHSLLASGAPVLVAQPPPVAASPIHAVAGGPAPGTAVGAGPDSAHLVAPAAAPAHPVAQRLAESQIRGAAGGQCGSVSGARFSSPSPLVVAPSAPLAAPVPLASVIPQVHTPRGDRAPPAFVHPISATPYPPLPWIPPLPDTGFVGAGGGGARGAFVPPRRFADAPSMLPPPPLPVPPVALATGVAEVPTATLAQLWRLVECQRALTLILVNSHFAILQSLGSTLGHEARADCLAAAAQLAFLLLPVLGAPAMGGVAVSELDATVQGLTAHLQAGGGIEIVSATALVVQQLWRTMRVAGRVPHRCLVGRA